MSWKGGSSRPNQASACADTAAPAGIFAATFIPGLVFLAVSADYMLSGSDTVLLAIPFAALAAALLLTGAPVRRLLAVFFLVHLLAASLFLFLEDGKYNAQGVLAFMYLAAAAAVSYFDLGREGCGTDIPGAGKAESAGPAFGRKRGGRAGENVAQTGLRGAG